MAYKKPQNPLINNGFGIYPLTTADQVILSDGSRLEKDGKINADKLGGKTLAQIMLELYPVGAVYISANSTSPASLFGGTWEQLKDRFLLGAGSAYAAGSTGGEATHKLTVSEMPSHIHSVNIASTETRNRVIWADGYGSSDKNAWGFGYVEDTSSGLPTGTHGVTAAYTGGSQSHNNMPPYLAVYMWRRVS